jgi:TetR/AcrR family transcriptional regulator, cholesterol catabolism regulator
MVASDAQPSTETRPQPRTAHSERVLASVLLPAASIIRKRGILGASVEELVEAVGVTKGTLYYHVRTKEGLLFRIHESVTNEGYERWLKVIEETKGQPASTTLRRMIEEHCAVIRDYRDCVAVISEEMKYLSADMQDEIRQWRADYQALLESVLERGVDDGEFVVASIHQTASIMIGMLNSMYRWYSPDGPMSVSELADTATELLLLGLRG